MNNLATVDEVITALGGQKSTAGLAGVKSTAVSNWRKEGRFACNTYALMIAALNQSGKTAPPSLWGMKGEPSGASKRGLTPQSPQDSPPA